MISKESIKKVIERVNITEVISEYVNLKRVGQNLVGLCPFHPERTASFTVSPRKGIFKCFGCGISGDAIKFIQEHNKLSFPETIRLLADKYHVAIEESRHEPSEAERRDAQKREAASHALSLAQEYYESAFTSENKYAQSAREYAYSRWPKELCDQIGIGYAPSDDSGFIACMKRNSISTDVLVEVGLAFYDDKDDLRAIFRNRIIIPDRNQYSSIINFTGRTLSTNPKVPKYLNLKDSILYNKSRNLFGIDMARKHAPGEDKIYLVEGAPDVLRLQSINYNNVVAALGTSWTPDQFRLLKRYTSNVVFIPDIDTPKPGEQYGPGIRAVMKAGVMAAKLGLGVKVKEIPIKTDDNGQVLPTDPDSYFVRAELMNDVKEIDFINWYADKLFIPGLSQMEIDSRIKIICSALIDTGNDGFAAVFLEQYPKTRNGGKIAWKRAYKELLTSSVEEKKKSIDNDSAIEQPRGNAGYFIANNCYCSYGKNDEIIRWSNFIFKPFYDVSNNGLRTKLLQLVNELGATKLVAFTAEDFSSIQNFRKKLTNSGDYLWFSKIEELMRVLEQAYTGCKHARIIETLGFQKDQSFAYGNGLISEGVFIPVDEHGMVTVDNSSTYYLPAFSEIHKNNDNEFVFEKSFKYINNSSMVNLENYVKLLVDVYGDNAKVGFTYVMASLFHDVIFKQHDFFPILNVVGEKGTGKSHLAMALRSFFIAENKPINIETQTFAGCSQALAQVENALVHFDEYKNSIGIAKIEMLKGSYDGVARGKMRDNVLEYNKVKTGVVLTGQEMPTFDIALFTRVLFLTSSRTEFTTKERELFDELSVIRKQGLGNLTAEILSQRQRFKEDYPASYRMCLREVLDRLDGKIIEDRILKNWTVILATFKCLENALSLPFTYADLFDFCFPRMLEQNAFSKQNNEIGNFWNFLYVLYQEGKIWENADFKIVYATELRLEGSNKPIEFGSRKKLLFLRPSRLLALYDKEGSREGQLLMSKANIRQYLGKSKGCIGKSKTRYDRMIEGRTQYENREDANGVTHKGRKLQDEERSFVFEYDVVCDVYGISLRPESE